MVTIDILAAFNSAISALLYGLFFSFIMNLVILVFKISQLVTHAFFADEYNEKSKIEEVIKANHSKKTPLVITILGILFFGIGYSIITYFSLDGRLRLYSILSSFLGCYIIDRHVAPNFTFFILLKTGMILFLLNKTRKNTKYVKMKNIFHKKSKNTQTNDHPPS